MKSGAKSTIAGTHLPVGCDYRLNQFHAHWGEDKKSGSEHFLNGKPYSGEVSIKMYILMEVCKN